MTIKDLKSKITELYVDLQTTNQNRILSENEVQSLQGELKAALAAKEWYKVGSVFAVQLVYHLIVTFSWG